MSCSYGLTSWRFSKFWRAGSARQPNPRVACVPGSRASGCRRACTISGAVLGQTSRGGSKSCWTSLPAATGCHVETRESGGPSPPSEQRPPTASRTLHRMFSSFTRPRHLGPKTRLTSPPHSRSSPNLSDSGCVERSAWVTAHNTHGVFSSSRTSSFRYKFTEFACRWRAALRRRLDAIRTHRASRVRVRSAALRSAYRQVGARVGGRAVARTPARQHVQPPWQCLSREPSKGRFPRISGQFIGQYKLPAPASQGAARAALALSSSCRRLEGRCGLLPGGAWQAGAYVNKSTR